MKHEDPIDRLLQRASAPRAGTRPPGDCLDAETLAAWTDGTLNASARADAEAHAADCDRCLAVLAAIAKTTPPPTEATPSWFSVRWLVPLATAALAITTWVVVQNPREPAPEPAVADTKAVDALQRTAPALATPPAAPPPASLAAPPAATAQSGSGARSESAAKTVTANDARAAFASPTVVVSPDPNVRWRFLAATLERSTDAGATWHPITLPDTKASITQVTAATALAATVTTSTGVVYQTVDGGRTWRVQENAAAPF